MSLPRLFSSYDANHPRYTAEGIVALGNDYYYADVARGTSGRQKAWRPSIIRPSTNHWGTPGPNRWEVFMDVKPGQGADIGKFIVQHQTYNDGRRARVVVPDIESAVRILHFLAQELANVRFIRP